MSKAKLRPSKTKLPKFANEDQEREFWATHDSADYIDWPKAKPVKLSNLRPTTRTISIRMPEAMLERLKTLANKRDVSYQSLLKIFVADKIEQELRDPR